MQTKERESNAGDSVCLVKKWPLFVSEPSCIAILKIPSSQFSNLISDNKDLGDVMILGEDGYVIAHTDKEQWGKDYNLVSYYQDAASQTEDSGRFTINKDYAAMETSEWTKDFQNSKAGVHIDVSDQAWRYQKKFTEELEMGDDIVWVMGMPAGPNGKKIQPTSGHAGFVEISRDGAPKEQDMKDALNFLDICNTKEGQNLLNFGAEGVHYDLNSKGELTRRTFPQDPIEGFNQFMTNVVDGLLLQEEMKPVQKRQKEVLLENIPYCVANPAEPLTSDTYAEKGAQLDQIISDARNQYIAGQIDEAGFKAVVADWYAQGGTAICEEYAAAYKAAGN